MILNRYKKAFTLPELVVVVAMLSILTLLISTIIVRSFQTYRFNREGAGYQEQALRAMLDFEKNVRGATEIVSSDVDNFEFYVYLPKDDYPAPSKVRYFFENNQMKRAVIRPEGIGPVFDYPPASEVISVVIYNVTSPNLFNYFNDVSEEITEPVAIDAVRMVKITLSVDKDTSTPPATVTETTSISLRNLKTNL